MKSRMAFTKKDLVTVLCCLVFLLMTLNAIGSGYLKRTIEQDRRAICLNKLRQLTLAWIVYADETDEKLVNGAAGIDRKKDKVLVDKAWQTNKKKLSKLERYGHIARTSRFTTVQVVIEEISEPTP
jgi:hypothetical protein